MGRVAHGAELGDEEVVAAMVGRRVLLDVGKFHKLKNKKCKKLPPAGTVMVGASQPSRTGPPRG